METISKGTTVVALAMSGQFIELERQEKTDEVLSVWRPFIRTRRQLASIERQLELCNDVAWLSEFHNKCRVTGKDFETALRKHADTLEQKKTVRTARVEQAREKLRTLSSTFAEMSPALRDTNPATAIGPIVLRKVHSPEVAKRNAVIHESRFSSTRVICQHLDSYKCQIPEKWRDLGVETWTEAYADPRCQNRVHKLISETRFRK